jgi:hypothetical protein
MPGKRRKAVVPVGGAKPPAVAPPTEMVRHVSITITGPTRDGKPGVSVARGPGTEFKDWAPREWLKPEQPSEPEVKK